MKAIKNGLKAFLNRLLSTTAAGTYILLFAAAIAVATFIENDYGTSSAQKLVYKAWWFELLLLLFSATLITNVVKFRMVQQKKWSLLLFHSAMVIIIIGAAFTRYMGYEGVMHIRENDSSNTIYSSDTYLNFLAEVDGQQYEFSEAVLFSSIGSNRFSREFLLGNETIALKVESVVPNPEKKLIQDPEGLPTLKIVFGQASGRAEYYLQYGEQQRLHGVLFNFTGSAVPNAVNLSLDQGKPMFLCDRPAKVTVMRDQSVEEVPAGEIQALKLRSLYEVGGAAFVFGEYEESARLVVESSGIKLDRNSELGINISVTINGDKMSRMISGSQGMVGNYELFEKENIKLGVSYGAKIIELPFGLFLRDFIMERYPGTNSPASYASEVTLRDPRSNLEMDYRIFMNNILNYDGFRFFQSSYDQDEQGTYLSVNSDFWGTNITYLGYALLTLGMMLIFFSKNTRFRKLSESLNKLKRSAPVLALGLLVLSGNGQSVLAQSVVEPKVEIVQVEHAAQFSKLTVQDFRGRMKPIHTLSRELLRKVSGKELFQDYNADQTILSMWANPDQWYGVNMVKLGRNEDLQKLIGRPGQKTVAYRDFFNKDGSYKLQNEIVKANNTNPADRGVFENQLLKVDERVNIMNMIFSGTVFRLIPQKNDPSNTWVSEFSHTHAQTNENVASAFFQAYKSKLHHALHSGDYADANGLLNELNQYQHQAGVSVVLPNHKIKAEILLNESKIFNRLALLYTLLGLTFLSLLFLSVFYPKLSLQKIQFALALIVLVGFVLQTTGLGLRWYVSGRAPWSNGYESMIYIAWTSALAGLLFTRKSLGGMSATMVLSGTVLLIAMLSYLDPEITPLVPVLKSYWLTIHVSLEAGSYGFLLLGAIIGLINLLLMLVLTERNKTRIQRIVKEMTIMSEMTIIGGIVMLSVGTYLGGVWANESWGRYWGWDAKETWALVSILVYAFILHMRLIPKLNNLYTFNLATLFGLSSIIMTYFGVNYYLSGLHSYAAGDPVPIPDWVYVSVASLVVVGIGAFWKYRRVLGK